MPPSPIKRNIDKTWVGGACARYQELQEGDIWINKREQKPMFVIWGFSHQRVKWSSGNCVHLS